MAERVTVSDMMDAREAASSEWLLAGKTLYFFSVLLTGCGSLAILRFPSVFPF